MNTRKLIGTAGLLAVCASTVLAQTTISFYRSGSTGADGAFAPVIVGTTISSGAPPGSRVVPGSIGSTAVNYIDVPLPTNGTLNFTTITIAKNTRVRFLVDSSQFENPPPAILLATGDIRIAGEISVTAKDTACAYGRVATPNLDDDSTSWTNRWMPGPGGYRGGIVDRDHGTGWNPGAYNAGYATDDESFCLPLVGGSGGAYWKDNGPGVGGAGVLYLASSTKIIFDGDYGVTGRGIVFRDSRCSSYTARGGQGMAAIFANEVQNNPRSSDNNRMLVSACAHTYGNTTYRSIYPMWNQGIIGNSMPTNPVVRIAAVGTNTIPETASQTDLFLVQTTANYSVTIETRNLPANIVFNLYVWRLNSDQTYSSSSTYEFPGTMSVGGGVCRATNNAVGITPGYQLLRAKAKAAITVAMAPTFQGSPIQEWRYDEDINGKPRVMYATTSGAILSQEAALRLALEQGKWEFLRAFGGREIPRS